jgi:hypothetical protein
VTDRPRLLDKEFDALMAMCFTPAQLAAMAPLQRIELRRFYFAGARSFSRMLMEHTDAGDEVTDRDMALIDALQTELRNFSDDFANGRA